MNQNNNYKYDLAIVGAGAAGIAAAYIASRSGIKTVLIDRSYHCGGLMTSGLVVPVMKLNDCGINTEFSDELNRFADLHNASITYCDGNKHWYNPELLKTVFDEMLKNAGCDILYGVNVSDAVCNDGLFGLTCSNDTLSLCIETKYLVDSTGNGNISRKLFCEKISDTEKKQAMSLRFIMSGVNAKEFSDWIMCIDKDRNVTTSAVINNNIYFSTACTADNPEKWALTPYFNRAVLDGILKPSDCAYFQVFSVAGCPESVAFNAPRLIPDNDGFDYNNQFDISDLIIQGRASVERLKNFAVRYLPGFQKAYISNIAEMPGIREECRIKGRHIFTVDDIISGVMPENIALASDYPIDIHSSDKPGGSLIHVNHVWYLPLESLISEKYENLFIAGRCLSASFEAHAAVRTQLNCFSTGEAIAKHIINLNKTK